MLDDGGIELSGLGMRMRGIDRGQQYGLIPRTLGLQQQDRPRAEPQQFPIGQVHQPGLEALALVAVGNDEVRARVFGAAHDGLVRRKVPSHVAGGFHAALAGLLRHLFQARAPQGEGFALDLCE